MASLHFVLRSTFSDAIDPMAVGPEVSQMLANDIARGMQLLDRSGCAPPGRVLDVRYTDLLRDPIGMVRKIYAHFDLPLHPQVEVRMRQCLAAESAGQEWPARVFARTVWARRRYRAPTLPRLLRALRPVLTGDETPVRHSQGPAAGDAPATAVVALLALPLVVILVVVGVESGDASRILLPVVNDDQGAVATALCGVLREYVDVQEVDRAAAERLVAIENAAPAVLILPAGLTQRFRAGQPSTLELLTDPARWQELGAVRVLLLLADRKLANVDDPFGQELLHLRGAQRDHRAGGHPAARAARSGAHGDVRACSAWS